MGEILSELNDPSSQGECSAFFRPSFGRRGGNKSSEFGEFDFILLSKECVYLGESKWHRSSEQITGGQIELRKEQLTRHKIFHFYLEKWFSGNYPDWESFSSDMSTEFGARFGDKDTNKPVAPVGSLLAENIECILRQIRDSYSGPDLKIRDLLLYFHLGDPPDRLPTQGNGEFAVVCLDYSEDTLGNLIRLQ